MNDCNRYYLQEGIVNLRIKTRLSIRKIADYSRLFRIEQRGCAKSGITKPVATENQRQEEGKQKAIVSKDGPLTRPIMMFVFIISTKSGR